MLHPKSANIFRLFRNKWNIYSTQKIFYVMISNFEDCVAMTKNVIITKLNSFRHTFTSTRDVTRIEMITVRRVLDVANTNS